MLSESPRVSGDNNSQATTPAVFPALGPGASYKRPWLDVRFSSGEELQYVVVRTVKESQLQRILSGLSQTSGDTSADKDDTTLLCCPLLPHHPLTTIPGTIRLLPRSLAVEPRPFQTTPETVRISPSRSHLLQQPLSRQAASLAESGSKIASEMDEAADWLKLAATNRHAQKSQKGLAMAR